MPRRAKGVTAAKVAKATSGRFCDGFGLHLRVRNADAKFWVWRYTRNGETHELGLGSAVGPGAVTLAEARDKVADLRRMLRDGTDPLAAKRAAQAAKRKAPLPVHTFKKVADRYITNHEAGWRNAKHAAQWSSTLETYAYPVIGEMSVAEVATGNITTILEPIWRVKPETASRVRGRIETVLDYAKANGWRSGENPARWKGHLDHILPRKEKVRKVEHHAALDWREIGAFMLKLGEQNGIGALALRFAILTAARSGEVRGAVWSEISLQHKTWTVPAARMKGGREHRVPLSDAAVAVLSKVWAMRLTDEPDQLVFPGALKDKPLSDMSLSSVLKRMKRDDLTVHGFRSTFRDWCAEHAGAAREVAEAALAHAVGDKVEAAYFRGDLFERRRRLMATWGEFAMQVPSGDNVVKLREA